MIKSEPPQCWKHCGGSDHPNDVSIQMADEIISRAQAQARGLPKYFTGKSCKHGHVSPRRTVNGVCIACQLVIEARWRDNNREAFREKVRRQAARHRKENPERIRRNQKAYVSAHKDRELARQKLWRTANPEKMKASYKRHYDKHRDAILARLQKWQAANRFNPEHKKRVVERMRRWEEQNPERAKENRRKVRQTRRARQYNAGGSYTNAEIRQLLIDQNFRCNEVTCGIDLSEGKELDHVIPISKGGPHCIGNLQYLCPSCNSQKRDMMPDEWRAYRVKLTTWITI
jgi:5-methylcytosine-specific restriction endonuclease McrA